MESPQIQPPGIAFESIALPKQPRHGRVVKSMFFEEAAQETRGMIQPPGIAVESIALPKQPGHRPVVKSMFFEEAAQELMAWERA